MGPGRASPLLSLKALNRYTWHEGKAVINYKKHAVSFEEAVTVFNDPCFIDFYDPDHSESEERFIIVGLSNRQRLLIVSYTERQDSIRLISARKATRQERKQYEEQRT